MVFFDVDGVIADFRLAYTNMTGYQFKLGRDQFEDIGLYEKYTDEELAELFLNMPLLPEGKFFLYKVQLYEWKLLTAIPNTHPKCQEARLSWLKNLGYGDIDCIFSCDKSVWAGDYRKSSPNILVDDNEETCMAWEGAMGNCIRYYPGGELSGQDVIEIIGLLQNPPKSNVSLGGLF